MSFEPLRNPLGFGIPDYIELVLALILAASISVWPRFAGRVHRFAANTRVCMVVIGLLPIMLRLALLAHHPMPIPDLYDEFGHLLVADTLRHLRFANPPHPFAQFFETHFVLQSPTYSGIYPPGNGLMLAFGTFVLGTPWAGVLLCTGVFCALIYWMLRGWTTPEWALLGGLLAVCLFGPLNQWTNNYWGGELSAAAGCLVFGGLPRQNSKAIGLGIAIHILTRPYETVFLVLAVLLYRLPRRVLMACALLPLVALGVTAVQNRQVTGQWLTLPYALSQYQYGVPAALTFQSDPVPHRALTPQQDLDYRMQKGFLAGKETLATFAARMVYRIRYYRFYLYAPLYLALFAFLIRVRTWRDAFLPVTALLFALGINFFPAFQFHYLAAVVGVLVLMAVRGLQTLPPLASRFLVVLAFAQFGAAYAAHVVDAGGYDLWTSVNHTHPERRREIAEDLAKIPGQLIVFVRYAPNHPFQEEWVYNSATIDSQRIVWARDLGNLENQRLLFYYGNSRTPVLLEPDARPLAIRPWVPEPQPEAAPEIPEKITPEKPGKKPMLRLEQVM